MVYFIIDLIRVIIRHFIMKSEYCHARSALFKNSLNDDMKAPGFDPVINKIKTSPIKPFIFFWYLSVVSLTAKSRIWSSYKSVRWTLLLNEPRLPSGVVGPFIFIPSRKYHGKSWTRAAPFFHCCCFTSFMYNYCKWGFNELIVRAEVLRREAF